MVPTSFLAIPRFGLNRIVPAVLIATAVVALVLVPPRVGAAPAGQRTGEERPNITVFGEAEIRAEPDLAIASVGVTHTAPTSQEAIDEVSRRLADVLASVRALGIEDRDIQTSGVSLQPIMRQRQPGDDSTPEIEAYRASSNVTITVRDIPRASTVLDAAAQSGANVISGLRFGLSNMDELRLRALGAATGEAERKARAIASAAGLVFAGVISLTEDGVSAPRTQAGAVALPGPSGGCAGRGSTRRARRADRARTRPSLVCYLGWQKISSERFLPIRGARRVAHSSSIPRSSSA